LTLVRRWGGGRARPLRSTEQCDPDHCRAFAQGVDIPGTFDDGRHQCRLHDTAMSFLQQVADTAGDIASNAAQAGEQIVDAATQAADAGSSTAAAAEEAAEDGGTAIVAQIIEVAIGITNTAAAKLKEAENAAAILNIVMVIVSIILVVIAIVVAVFTFGTGAAIVVGAVALAGFLIGLAASAANVGSSLMGASIGAALSTLGAAISVGALSAITAPDRETRRKGRLATLETLARILAALRAASLQPPTPTNPTPIGPKVLAALDRSIDLIRRLVVLVRRQRATPHTLTIATQLDRFHAALIAAREQARARAALAPVLPPGTTTGSPSLGTIGTTGITLK
jgi:uncharacterized membrane protein